MDLLLLGAMAVVLIALTLWLVWRPSSETARPEVGDKSEMTPMGDEFEDQYTSATADLSAGGVAITGAHKDEPVAEPSIETPTYAPVEAPVESTRAPSQTPPSVAEELQRASPSASRTKMQMGAAAALTLGGAAAGAWLYARWQRERNKPINRLRRRFR